MCTSIHWQLQLVNYVLIHLKLTSETKYLDRIIKLPAVEQIMSENKLKSYEILNIRTITL